MCDRDQLWVIELGDAWLIVKKADYDPGQLSLVCVGGKTRKEALMMVADIERRRRAIR